MAMDRASYSVTGSDLESMVLEKKELPEEFQGHQMMREGELDNETMAEQGFADSTAQRFRGVGRVNGYMREFGPAFSMAVLDGTNVVAATVAHLFNDPESVHNWMHDVFLKDFEERVGEGLSEGQQLVSVERLEPAGLFDEAVALKVLQGGSPGLFSSTVVDFRVGRLLGVAFVGTVGDHLRLDLASQLALSLEKRMVRVVLGD
jgi:hypothetical protein